MSLSAISPYSALVNSGYCSKNSVPKFGAVFKVFKGEDEENLNNGLTTGQLTRLLNQAMRTTSGMRLGIDEYQPGTAGTDSLPIVLYTERVQGKTTSYGERTPIVQLVRPQTPIIPVPKDTRPENFRLNESLKNLEWSQYGPFRVVSEREVFGPDYFVATMAHRLIGRLEKSRLIALLVDNFSSPPYAIITGSSDINKSKRNKTPEALRSWVEEQINPFQKVLTGA